MKRKYSSLLSIKNFEDGSTRNFYIPLRMMRWLKENPTPGVPRTVLADWAWAYPTYSFDIDAAQKIQMVEIDPSGLMADIERDNNTFKPE